MSEVKRFAGVLRWSTADIAELTGYTRSAVQRWMDGTAQAPGSVREWLADLVDAHERLPAPGRVVAVVNAVAEAAPRKILGMRGG
jgi:transcriptional regulator with XRE-family HTH domain